MSNGIFKCALKGGAAPVALGLALLATPAFAQDASTLPPTTGATTDAAVQQEAADEGAQDIVVTGSLISNPNLDRAAPVNVTTADEIELLQANVAEEILREIPGIVPSVGSAVNNGNGGASFVNLRGLGANRNVVLLDGNRIVPANLDGLTDLNNIPLALLDRLDVLTGGASTTYGADAIAGVVNFVTKRDFAGLEATASNQITQEGDGNVFRVDLTIGANFDDGRGNVVLGIGYQEADPVFQGDRDISRTTVETFSGTALGSGTAVPSRFSVPGQGTLQVNPATGTLVPTFSTFNFNPFNVFQTPFERFNIYGSARYEINDSIEFYTRGLFSKNTVDTVIAPSGAFGLPVQISLNSPFLPAAVRAQFCAANDSNATLAGVQTLTAAQCAAAALATGPGDPNYREITTSLFRRSVEAGPRISSYTTTVFDYRAGLRGNITGNINYDLSGAYGESENIQTISGYFLNSRVRQSLLLNRAASGTVTCQNPANGCVPVDFFGAAGSIDQAGVDFLTETATSSVRTTLAQVKGTINGDFGLAPFWSDDAIAFAVGGEYRKYGASQSSDALTQSGDLGGAGGATLGFEGGYEVYEAIAEVVVPIFDMLTLDGGVRYSDYRVDAPGTPSFDTWTYKGGATFTPVEGISLRGTYARAVRAPNIAELFAPVNTLLTNISDDPCATRNSAGAPLPGRAALSGELLAVCLAQGAPAFTIGTIQQPTAGQINFTGGGNLALRPEVSDSYTVGLILQPRFLPGFTASIDYYNIKIDRAITSPTPGDAIAACFGNPTGVNFNPPAGSAASDACTSIRRNPLTGGLDGDAATTPGLLLQLTNGGSLETDGIDVILNYRTEITDQIGLGLSFNGNYTFNSKFNAFVASPDSINRECTGFLSGNCGSLQPEFQWTQRTTLTFSEDVDVSLLWRHIDSIVQEPLDVIAQGPFFNGTVPTSVAGVGGRTVDFGRIGAYDYFDLSTRFGVTENFVVTLTVQNLFDKKPPLVGNNAGSTTFNSGNTYPSTYDAVGRRFALQGRITF